MVAVASDASASAAAFPHMVSISADGTKYRYLGSYLGAAGSASIQLYLSAGASSGFVSLPPGGQTPDGNVFAGMISDDASVVVFGSTSNYLGGAGPLTYARTLDGSNLFPFDTPSYFTPRTPLRIVDTRSGLG